MFDKVQSRKCGRAKSVTNESLLVYEQLCRKGCRKCNIHNWLTPPGLFTLSIYRSISLYLSLPLLMTHSIEFRLTTIVQSQLCTKNEERCANVVFRSGPNLPK